MGLFISFIVFGVLALALLAIGYALPKAGSEEKPRMGRRGTRLASGILAGIALLALFFSSFTTVGTKNVAVLTVAGRPVGYLDNGFHWKKPWAKPHQISDAVQTDTYASNEGNLDQKQGGATETCIHVRIARQATACVNTSIRWQIRGTGVDYLYRNYKSNDHITDNVVLRDLQQALNEAFINFDPLGIDASGNNTNPPLTNYADTVLSQMRTEIGQWIDVQSVIIPLLNYDSSTQAKVNQLLQQIANTRVAIQAEQTAIAQARANQALAKSVSNDPNVLISKCLDILKEAVDKGMALPAGFSCFGSTPPVAIGTK